MEREKPSEQYEIKFYKSLAEAPNFGGCPMVLVFLLGIFAYSFVLYLHSAPGFFLCLGLYFVGMYFGKRDPYFMDIFKRYFWLPKVMEI